MATVNAASSSGRSIEDFTIPTSQRTTGPQLGQQDFLKIMIEQLKGQNPLEPQDNNQFFAQMVQFQSLDAMTAMQKAIDHLSLVSGLASATTLIGKTISASIPQPVNPKTGVPVPNKLVNGKVENVTFSDSGAVLHVEGNISVPADKVTKVS